MMGHSIGAHEKSKHCCGGVGRDGVRGVCVSARARRGAYQAAQARAVLAEAVRVRKWCLTGHAPVGRRAGDVRPVGRRRQRAGGDRRTCSCCPSRSTSSSTTAGSTRGSTATATRSRAGTCAARRSRATTRGSARAETRGSRPMARGSEAGGVRGGACPGRRRGLRRRRPCPNRLFMRRGFPLSSSPCHVMRVCATTLYDSRFCQILA